MAEPTQEEKDAQAALDAKLNEKLKELGYDEHAKNVIAKTNAEAKANREKAEELAKKLKDREDADAKREADEKKTKDEADEKARKEADEKKSVNERFDQMEKTFAERIAERDKALAAKQAEFETELSARDQQIVREAVLAAASKRGIIDESLLGLFDISKVPVERGVPSREAIDLLIEEHAKAKPHLYKDPVDEPARGNDGRFTRPTPKDGKADVDAAKLTPAQLEEMTERFKRQKV